MIALARFARIRASETLEAIEALALETDRFVDAARAVLTGIRLAIEYTAVTICAGRSQIAGTE
jgi:hypothetical protein